MNANSAKNRSPCIPNQPSEALCHFMFELAKNLVQRAGGTTSTSMFVGPTQNNTPPHRNLHLCAITIALYALGVNNHVQTNWMIRTYSSLVSWITLTAIDIGLQAILILIECWEGQLTPPECATIADRASRSRDSAVVRTAAELALSTLKYAHALNAAEIRQALEQCKEQSTEMLERALTTIENATRDGNLVLIDILFEVAKRWYEMYYERTGDSLSNGDDVSVVDIRQPFDSNNSNVTPTNSMELHWNNPNIGNPQLGASASTIMYANTNQNPSFQAPFQPHPPPHFNGHPYMIQTTHGPPPAPPALHHHQIGSFHQQVSYQQMIPIQYAPSTQSQQQPTPGPQQHFAFHPGSNNSYHTHPHHPRHPSLPPQLTNAILVSSGNFQPNYAVHHQNSTASAQMYGVNQNQTQSFYPVRQIPMVLQTITDSTISPPLPTNAASQNNITPTNLTSSSEVVMNRF